MTTNKQRKTKPIRNKPIPESFAGKVYLDPTYDPAFKELFDSEEALKDFLDGILELEGDDKIKNLRFKFEEHLVFRVPDRKRVIFDIFATTGNGRFLNIEMQRLESEFFIDRTILYKAFLVIKGRKEMERSPEYQALSKEEQRFRRYQLPETISIWICDFDLPDAKGEYRDEWALYSRYAVKVGNATPLSPKNKYIFLSVPNFTKSASEVKGPADAWLYLLNHARDGGELPDFGSGIVEEALERIRVENADDKLLEAQELNMTTKEDYESWAAGIVIKAKEKLRAEFDQKFRAEFDQKMEKLRAKEEKLHAEEEKLHADTLSVLKDMGLSPEQIAEAKARLTAKRTNP